MSDAGLISRAINGDSEALCSLLGQHGPAVEKTLRIDAIWQAVLDPADVMQVTYLEAFMQINRFDPNKSDSFEAWLRRIATNNLRDAVRGLARQKQPQPRDRVRPAPGKDSIVGLVDLLGVTTTTPSRNARMDETCCALESAINALPELYGLAVRMYDLEGTSIAEVAEALGRSPGAVHMIRSRAHERLREQLGTASMYFNKGG